MPNKTTPPQNQLKLDTLEKNKKNALVTPLYIKFSA